MKTLLVIFCTGALVSKVKFEYRRFTFTFSKAFKFIYVGFPRSMFRIRQITNSNILEYKHTPFMTLRKIILLINKTPYPKTGSRVLQILIAISSIPQIKTQVESILS